MQMPRVAAALSSVWLVVSTGTLASILEDRSGDA